MQLQDNSTGLDAEHSEWSTMTSFITSGRTTSALGQDTLGGGTSKQFHTKFCQVLPVAKFCNLHYRSGQSTWMPVPQAPPGCPPGLEYMTQIDQLLVKQQVELLEAFTGFETNNKYKIMNSQGQKVYFAAEDNDCCSRQCCGNIRSFEMKIMDNSQNEVIHLSRPLRCMHCMWACCLQELEVQSPPGTTVGWVKQTWHPFLPKFVVQNSAGETVLTIEGPCLNCSFCGDVEFDIMTADETSKVGKISKQWSGLAREMFTDADNFGIQFPMDLDVKVKACLLGAVFLIVRFPFLFSFSFKGKLSAKEES
ncbi:Phospholipid scramblase 3 [Branchiostoma belcheri]|nr:Phospholipid scramblase 3 [Branchiostoma belcheri]